MLKILGTNYLGAGPGVSAPPTSLLDANGCILSQITWSLTVILHGTINYYIRFVTQQTLRKADRVKHATCERRLMKFCQGKMLR